MTGGSPWATILSRALCSRSCGRPSAGTQVRPCCPKLGRLGACWVGRPGLGRGQHGAALGLQSWTSQAQVPHPNLGEPGGGAEAGGEGVTEKRGVSPQSLCGAFLPCRTCSMGPLRAREAPGREGERWRPLDGGWRVEAGHLAVGCPPPLSWLLWTQVPWAQGSPSLPAALSGRPCGDRSLGAGPVVTLTGQLSPRLRGAAPSFHPAGPERARAGSEQHPSCRPCCYVAGRLASPGGPSPAQALSYVWAAAQGARQLPVKFLWAGKWKQMQECCDVLQNRCSRVQPQLLVPQVPKCPSFSLPLGQVLLGEGCPWRLIQGGLGATHCPLPCWLLGEGPGLRHLPVSLDPPSSPEGGLH